MTAAILGVLALAGCEREAAPEQPTQTTAAPAPPLSFSQKSEHAEVMLKLPAGLASHPAVHRSLYDREVMALKTFAADAARDRAEFGADMPPFAMEVTWRVAAETDRLLSLVRDEYSFAGGAHPNSATTTLLLDKQARREVTLATLLPGSGVEPTLCDALKAEKAKRGGVPLDGDTWTCPKLKDSQAALTPGTGGDAAGLTFHFSPYEVGPYAEGSYEVAVPASAFRASVAADYRDQFAGG